MFNRLRNRIILIISTISFVILFSSFSIIYISSSQKLNIRRTIPIEAPDYNPEIVNIISERIIYERNYANKMLLRTLIRSGIAIELIVVIISTLLAEEIIRPARKAYETEKTFIANASHEIKTPLAAIQANLEAANITDNQWIENVAYETDKLASLNTELLTLSRLDALPEDIRPEKFDYHHFMERIIASIEPRLVGKKLTITYHDSELFMNRPDLEQLITILLDNAIKYSKTSISITCTEKSISITNDGKTIPEDQLAHIFDRFYQVDKTTEGVGLGLSIARSLADKNHWRLTAKSEKSKTTFELSF